MKKPLRSILFHYISFLPRSRDWFVTLQVQPSQDPGLPSKGRGTLAEWLGCRVRAGPEISKQSKAVTQPTESFQSQNHLRTITFRFGADVYNQALRTTHRNIPKVVSHLRPGLRSEHSWTQNLKLSYSCGLRHPDPQVMWLCWNQEVGSQVALSKVNT